VKIIRLTGAVLDENQEPRPSYLGSFVLHYNTHC
jgi:hypothetical protein